MLFEIQNEEHLHEISHQESKWTAICDQTNDAKKADNSSPLMEAHRYYLDRTTTDFHAMTVVRSPSTNGKSQIFMACVLNLQVTPFWRWLCLGHVILTGCHFDTNNRRPERLINCLFHITNADQVWNKIRSDSDLKIPERLRIRAQARKSQKLECRVRVLQYASE